VLPSGPVIVRVSPVVPLVRVSSQPAACLSMKGWVSSQLAPYSIVKGPLHVDDAVLSFAQEMLHESGV
jgi:hypothetical protein